MSIILALFQPKLITQFSENVQKCLQNLAKKSVSVTFSYYGPLTSSTITSCKEQVETESIPIIKMAKISKMRISQKSSLGLFIPFNNIYNLMQNIKNLMSQFCAIYTQVFFWAKNLPKIWIQECEKNTLLYHQKIKVNNREVRFFFLSFFFLYTLILLSKVKKENTLMWHTYIMRTGMIN